MNNLNIFYCLNNDKRIRHKFFNLVSSSPYTYNMIRLYQRHVEDHWAAIKKNPAIFEVPLYALLLIELPTPVVTVIE